MRLQIRREMFMDERNCPICGGKDKHKIDEIHLVNVDGIEGLFDHQIISGCNRCGAVFHEGIAMEQLEDYYGKYTGGGEIQSMTADEQILNSNMADFVEYHLRLEKDANILDVGCGFGWVIGILRERGYENVVGMDTDEALMQKLRRRGYSVECGSIYSQDKNKFNGKFDVIILKMVMEHLESPSTAIDNVRRWLAKDGILVIEVPDCSLYDKTAFFPGYFQSVNIEHINNFSIISLMNLMKKWRLVACESTDSSGIFPVLRGAFYYDEKLEKEVVFDNTDEKKICASLRKPSEKAGNLLRKIELLKGKKCIIWGISAFTRGLLAYTALKEMDIVFFVDKNIFYQGKTLLGKPVVAPKDLKGFEGIVVIPGKNSEQAILCNMKELNYKNETICLCD